MYLKRWEHVARALPPPFMTLPLPGSFIITAVIVRSLRIGISSPSSRYIESIKYLICVADDTCPGTKESAEIRIKSTWTCLIQLAASLFVTLVSRRPRHSWAAAPIPATESI